MRIQILAVLAAAVALSGCQLTTTSASVPTANKQQTDWAAECLKHSSLKQPLMAGEAIYTKSHVVLSLINQGAQQSGDGELCIVQTQSGFVELTPVTRLEFVKLIPSDPS